MTRKSTGASGMFLAATVSLLMTFALSAQSAKPKTGASVQGTVQAIDKANAHITLVTGNIKKEVKYDSDTRFLYGHSKDNKPGSVNDVKDNYFVSCAGTVEAGKSELLAKQCVYREAK
jgi:hypothetical protein